MNKTLDIFSGFQDDNERNLIKRLIITSILATDMSKHNKLLAKFAKRVEATRKLREMKNEGQEIDELTNYLNLTSENPEDRRVYYISIYYPFTNSLS